MTLVTENLPGTARMRNKRRVEVRRTTRSTVGSLRWAEWRGSYSKGGWHVTGKQGVKGRVVGICERKQDVKVPETAEEMSWFHKEAGREDYPAI